MERTRLLTCTASLVLSAACARTGGLPAASDASSGSRLEGGTLDAASRSTSDGAAPAPRDSGSAGSLPEASLDGGTLDKPIARTFVFVGGWDFGNATSYPLRSYTLDRDTGELTQNGEPVDLGPNPSYIAARSDGRFLYVANERGDANGGVTVGEVDLETGIVTKRDHESGDSVDVVFTSLDPAEKHVLAASYGGARLQVFPIEANGTLGPAVDTETFASGAQTHSIRVHGSGDYAFAPNKGTDRIAQFTYDEESGALSANPTEALLEVPAGKGPRHIALHPNRKWAYVMHENTSEVSAYQIGSEGTLDLLETESSLPPGHTDTNLGAHVLVHPNGRFLYASNRGHDSIAAFTIASDGKLTLLEHEPSRGDTPRNFDIDTEGELLVVANQDSGSVCVLAISGDGHLSPLGGVVSGLPMPNAVAIVDVR